MVWLTFEMLTLNAVLITDLGGTSRSRKNNWEAIATQYVRGDGNLQPGGVSAKRKVVGFWVYLEGRIATICHKFNVKCRK